MKHNVTSYIEILLAYEAGKVIQIKDSFYYGGWRPKLSGTPWLFGVEEYRVDPKA